jgi:hypothetical protein
MSAEDTTTMTVETCLDHTGTLEVPCGGRNATTIPGQNTTATSTPDFCVDFTGARVGCDTLTVAETVGGASGLPATGGDPTLLAGGAFALIAAGVILGRVVRREHRGLGR